MQEEKTKLLNEKALDWLKANQGDDPEFSRIKNTTMIFNDNEAADDIELFLTMEGESNGFFVEPIDIVNATINGMNELKEK